MRFSLRLTGIGLALTALLVQATVVSAYQSVPSGDPQYWADASGGAITNPLFQPAGLSWTANSKNRLTAAVDEWDNDTQWNPQSNLTVQGDACWAAVGCHGVWIDLFDPSSGLAPNVLAYNRIKKDHKQDPADHTWYWDIKDSDITFNTFDYAYYVGAGQAPAGTVDFQGVLTHELGHAVLLIDLSICSANRETMCGSIATTQQSIDIRSLTADDIASANTVY